MHLPALQNHLAFLFSTGETYNLIVVSSALQLLHYRKIQYLGKPVNLSSTLASVINVVDCHKSTDIKRSATMALGLFLGELVPKRKHLVSFFGLFVV